MVTKRQRELLKKKLDTISADIKIKTIYRVKYGLDDGIEKSNKETGKIFSCPKKECKGITEEAIRQALQKIEIAMNR